MKNLNLIEKFDANGFVDIFKGNKKKNIQNFIGILAIHGANDMVKIAKLTTVYGKPQSYFDELEFRDYSQVLSYYNRLFSGRLKYTHGGKKIPDKEGNPKRYENPIKLEYVFKTNSKNVKNVKYVLTLKGIFLALGYNLGFDELKKVIENASKVSLFFCFIKTVMNATSIDFVYEIFIIPIRKVLLKSDIFQNGEMDFYFSNFADMISYSLLKMMRKINEDRINQISNQPDSITKQKINKLRKEYPDTSNENLSEIEFNERLSDTDDLIYRYKEKGIETLIDNVFFSFDLKEDWYRSLLEHFYTKEELKSQLQNFQHMPEQYLIYKVMREIHFTYYSEMIGLLPNYSRLKLKRSKQWIKQRKESRIKLPRSKEWKKHQKYKKSSGRFGKKP